MESPIGESPLGVSNKWLENPGDSVDLSPRTRHAKIFYRNAEKGCQASSRIDKALPQFAFRDGFTKILYNLVICFLIEIFLFFVKFLERGESSLYPFTPSDCVSSF